MARPRKEIDIEQFTKLCNLQCTLEEIAAWFECSEDTIENWCKREYNCRFSDIYKQYSMVGKISLRRAQFELAKKSTPMAIFLGKNYLHQRDVWDINQAIKANVDIREILQQLPDVILEAVSDVDIEP